MHAHVCIEGSNRVYEDCIGAASELCRIIGLAAKELKVGCKYTQLISPYSGTLNPDS